MESHNEFFKKGCKFTSVEDTRLREWRDKGND